MTGAMLCLVSLENGAAARVWNIDTSACLGSKAWLCLQNA